MRRLKCLDPRIVKAFTSLYQRFLLRHNLHVRAYCLQQQCRFPLSPKQAQEYKILDKIWIDGVLFSKKQCRKLHTGNVEWSLAITQQL